MSNMTPGEKHLLEVETLTTERWGVGAAVSVNEEDKKHVVRCWDKKGFEVLRVSRTTRDAALKAMASDLRLAKATAEVEVVDG